MAAPATSFALNWLNRWYLKLDRVHAASIKGSPWLKRVRFESTGGEGVAKPFTLYGHRGASGDLASAQAVSANQKASRKLRWLVPYGTYESSIRVPHRDIALSRRDKDAAARALQFDTDLSLKQHGSNLVRMWFQNPGYSLNSAARAHAAGVLTMANAQEVSNFIPGDQIVISTTSGNGASDVLVAGSAIGYVISRDFTALTVTVSATPGGVAGAPTNWAATSYFYFNQGNFLPASGGAIDILTPLQAYLPQSPAATTLHLVDRSIDSILSGFIPAAATLTGKSIAGRIKSTVNQHREQLGYLAEDSELDCAYVNPVDWGKAEEEFHSQGQREAYGDSATDGYMSLTVNTANGPLKLISEPNVPRGRMFLLAQNDIAWHTANGAVAEFVDQDGSIVSRMPSSNDLEMRPVSYIAAVMGAPFKHCHISAVA